MTKTRMSAFEGSTLETVLRDMGRDTIIETGAGSHMFIAHTARTGADKGYRMATPEDCCATLNADRRRAGVDYPMRNVATVTRVDAEIAVLGA